MEANICEWRFMVRRGQVRHSVPSAYDIFVRYVHISLASRGKGSRSEHAHTMHTSGAYSSVVGADEQKWGGRAHDLNSPYADNLYTSPPARSVLCICSHVAGDVFSSYFVHFRFVQFTILLLFSALASTKTSRPLSFSRDRIWYVMLMMLGAGRVCVFV